MSNIYYNHNWTWIDTLISMQNLHVLHIIFIKYYVTKVRCKRIFHCIVLYYMFYCIHNIQYNVLYTFYSIISLYNIIYFTCIIWNFFVYNLFVSSFYSNYFKIFREIETQVETCYNDLFVAKVGCYTSTLYLNRIWIWKTSNTVRCKFL